MEDKSRERRSGRMAEPGSFRAAALLNSTAGVQRVVCVCVWQMGSLITREKGNTHTRTQKRKRTHTPMHQGWHFLSAPLFLRPGSPWHQRQQDSLPACGGEGGNERSSWREEKWGPGEEEEDQEEIGLTLRLIQVPLFSHPPTSQLCVDRNLSAWLHWYCQLGTMTKINSLVSPTRHFFSPLIKLTALE